MGDQEAITKNWFIQTFGAKRGQYLYQIDCVNRLRAKCIRAGFDVQTANQVIEKGGANNGNSL